MIYSLMILLYLMYSELAHTLSLTCKLVNLAILFFNNSHTFISNIYTIETLFLICKLLKLYFDIQTAKTLFLTYTPLKLYS